MGALQTIRLPPPRLSSQTSLEEAISRRTSLRSFSPAHLTLEEVSQLLWASQGVTERGRRTTPSAGATYPLEIFLVCGDNISKLKPGFYHYHPDSHSLTMVLERDIRYEVSKVSLGQSFILQAPALIIICAIYERTSRYYGSRAERYVHMEVGHAGQNIYLQAVALGLGTVAVGAFHDEELRKIMNLESNLRPLYIMPVGRPE